jgi:hypothetical protein
LYQYIIYLETIVDGLWEVLDSNQLDIWLKKSATPWCVIQRKTSFHSEMALELAIGKGDLNIQDLEEGITDWDSEADILINIGFPGSTWFGDEPELRLESLPLQEVGTIMNKLIFHLHREDQCEWHSKLAWK